jgi:hypothetical protein
MTLMELQMQSDLNGYVYVNTADLGLIGCKSNDLIKIIDDDTKNFCILRIEGRVDLQNDILLGDANILEPLGFQENSFVEIELYNEPKVIVSEILVEFSTFDFDPKEMYTQETYKDLLNFISHYYLLNQTKLYWPEKSMNLGIYINKPQLNSMQHTVINPNSPPTIKLQEEIQKMAFNAILLIDKSRSMTTKDMKLANVSPVINQLITEFSGSLDSKSPFKKWLVSLNDYGDVMSRLDSVILATIIYFQQKISRGYGEKCAFILYADEAKAIPINGKEIFEATEFSPTFCEQLYLTIRKDSSFIGYKSTNISGSLDAAKDIILNISKTNQNPIMILLLTDGGPSNADSPSRVIYTSKILKTELDLAKIPCVMYTIGIGAARAQLMTDIAKIFNGEYLNVKDVQVLTQWYDRLAKNFSVTIVSGNRRP